jgi:small subunit ribosomal protein S27Ae
MASNLYKYEDGKLVRTHRACPKCGQGHFLADHYDRWSCGKCGYTIFKQKGKKVPSAAPGKGKRQPSRKRVKSMEEDDQKY